MGFTTTFWEKEVWKHQTIKPNEQARNRKRQKQEFRRNSREHHNDEKPAVFIIFKKALDLELTPGCIVTPMEVKRP